MTRLGQEYIAKANTLPAPWPFHQRAAKGPIAVSNDIALILWRAVQNTLGPVWRFSDDGTSCLCRESLYGRGGQEG